METFLFSGIPLDENALLESCAANARDYNATMTLRMSSPTSTVADVRREIEVTVAAGETGSACDILALASGLSKQRIKDAMNKGAVWQVPAQGAARRLRRATARVVAGDHLKLYYDPELLQRACAEPELLMDCARYSLWYKPPGLLTQGTHYGDHCALLRRVEQWAQPRRGAWLVHRLDREAAGLILVAHDRGAAAALSALFQGRGIEKVYAVEVRGALDAPGVSRRIDLPLDGDNAVTVCQVLAYDADRDVTCLQVQLITGRKHQIRRHLAAVDHPVMGDWRYGTAGGELQLVATVLRFSCPLSGAARDFDLRCLKPAAASLYPCLLLQSAP